MFESIKRHWSEARAGVVSDQVHDILQRYERMNPNGRYWVSSGFDAVLSELEDQLGPVAQWDAEHKMPNIRSRLQSRSCRGLSRLSLHAATICLPKRPVSALTAERWSRVT